MMVVVVVVVVLGCGVKGAHCMYCPMFECPFDYFLGKNSSSCDATNCQECTVCGGITGIDSWEVSGCSVQHDRVCSNCTVCISGVERESVACGAFSDRECVACVGCDSGLYDDGSGCLDGGGASGRVLRVV